MAYLPASTCTQEPPRNPAGLEYHASGLGVDTYRTTIDMGLLLLVCDADQPFAVFVNGLGDDIDAAVMLAGLVLNGPPTAGGVMGNHGEDRPPGARWR